MSNLNSLFDVVRGWAGPGSDTATITETFRPHDDVPSDSPLQEGDFVFQESDGKVSRATGTDLAAAADVAALAAAIAEAQNFWLVVDGNSDHNYDTLSQTGPIAGNGTMSHVPWKVTCIRGTYMVETEHYVTRSYAPGNKVTVVDGEVDITSSGNNPGFQPLGEVHEYDDSQGLLTICT